MVKTTDKRASSKKVIQMPQPDKIKAADISEMTLATFYDLSQGCAFPDNYTFKNGITFNEIAEDLEYLVAVEKIEFILRGVIRNAFENKIEEFAFAIPCIVRSHKMESMLVTITTLATQIHDGMAYSMIMPQFFLVPKREFELDVASGVHKIVVLTNEMVIDKQPEIPTDGSELIH
jgi:hypothetical protein